MCILRSSHMVKKFNKKKSFVYLFSAESKFLSQFFYLGWQKQITLFKNTKKI